MITTHQEQHAQHVVYIDALGYLYCADCHRDGLGLGAERVLNTRYDYCDACGRSSAESVEMVTVDVTVEHTAAKIF